jgi:hypothetical protein
LAVEARGKMSGSSSKTRSRNLRIRLRPKAAILDDGGPDGVRTEAVSR